MATVNNPNSGENDTFKLIYSERTQYPPFEDKTYNAGSLQVFTITFIDSEDNTSKYFNFALLPAIETTANRGQGGVPEVKPGIVTMTSMKYKNFLIPGATPVIQSIGVQSTVHQFVGAFIGSENISNMATRATMDFVYPLVATDPPWTNIENSFNKAKMFDHKVVQSGRPITMEMRSDVDYVYEGVIVGFKFYAVRADRAYYTMDLLGTNYPRQKPPLTKEDYITDGTLNGKQGGFTDIANNNYEISKDVKLNPYTKNDAKQSVDPNIKDQTYTGQTQTLPNLNGQNNTAASPNIYSGNSTSVTPTLYGSISTRVTPTLYGGISTSVPPVPPTE
jgi:hypothetical protein